MNRSLMTFGIALMILGVFPGPVSAQSGVVSLTITPPLFQVTLDPGATWRSEIKVVNSNSYPLTVYASPVNFEPQGEEGHGRLVPILNASDTTELANWIDISRDPVTIAPGKTASLPFTLAAPTDASPGGHYAAVLVGTAPVGRPQTPGASVQISSMISSLFFVRITGSVNEAGRIREFSTDRSIYDKPDVNFTLKFENEGNVHLQPEGYISIFNMWGKKEGELDINQQSQFGNVLPKSVRKFLFNWKMDASLFDVGRYSAVATLTFGTDARQNVTQTASFWVIPFTETAIVLGSLLAVILLLFFSIRLYVRRAFRLELEVRGIAPGGSTVAAPRVAEEKGFGGIAKTLGAPIAEGIVDLRRLTHQKIEPARAAEVSETALTVRKFLRKYIIFFVLAPLCILALLWLALYFKEALFSERVVDIKLINPQSSQNMIISGQSQGSAAP